MFQNTQFSSLPPSNSSNTQALAIDKQRFTMIRSLQASIWDEEGIKTFPESQMPTGWGR